MTTIASGFSGSRPFSCAQGRYGELIIVQGHGVQPRRWTGKTVGSPLSTFAGIKAPLGAPTIGVLPTVRHYVARIDVTKPGACYNAPPAVTIAAPASPPEGFRGAKASSYLNQGSVGEIIVSDGGKHYPAPPPVTLGATHGTGAVLTASLDGTPPASTGLHHWEIVEGPPFMDETELDAMYRSVFDAWRPVTINVQGSSGSATDSYAIVGWDCPGTPIPMTFSNNLAYTITGAGTGTGCQIRIGFYGFKYWTASTTPCVVWHTLCWGVSGITLINAGSGYSENSVVRVVINSYSTGKRLVLEGCTPGNARNTTTPRFRVASIAVTNQGSGYNVAPEVKITSTSGFGAYAESTVTGGKITGVALESGGGGYRTVPTVTAVSGGAEAFAVARPHLRGKYQCYYRYVDHTPESQGGPVPSNLSPVSEVDTGSGTEGILWTVAEPAPNDNGGRVLSVELWRTTGNQATTLYRVAKQGSGEVQEQFVDDLTDEELRDPNRAGYAAMPIVMPNGELNAMRFSRPPNNKAVVVRFQDRMWYAVDTPGFDDDGLATVPSQPNSIYFSEVDEPESVPDVNEFVLQQNARDGDAITALIPHGSALIIMQNRRCYSLSYARKPLLDANVTPIAYRGCMGQRCWDTNDGILYVMDRSGVYALSSSGQIEDLSAPVADLFRSRIDTSSTTWNFLVIDPTTRILRAFVALAGETSLGFPTCALCYSLDSKSWWVERYPGQISAGTQMDVTPGTYRVAVAAKPYNCVIDEGPYDIAQNTILSVSVGNRGSGYRTPPAVTVTGGSGAILQAVLDGSGGIGGIWILNGGYGYESPSITIGPPNDPSAPSSIQATATVTASGLALVPLSPFDTRQATSSTRRTPSRREM